MSVTMVLLLMVWLSSMMVDDSIQPRPARCSGGEHQ
jgi:hypothetical protein